MIILNPLSLISDIASFVGRGLVFSEGDIHKRQRKMMNPAFSHNNNIKVINYMSLENLTLN
jgi:cytochrome P450